MYHNMRDAAKSRSGYADYRTSLRATGNICANLLGLSYRRAYKNFDAMESRCFDTGIRFLENSGKITGLQAAAAVGLTLFAASLSLLLR
jgi:cobalt/nickel transport system permease protein